jgi:hypothetical protein
MAALAAAAAVLFTGVCAWSSTAPAQQPPQAAPAGPQPGGRPSADPGVWTTVAPQPQPPAAAAPRAPTGIPPSGNTTVVPRSAPEGAAAAGGAQMKLVALLTSDGQRIDKGLVWRVFDEKGGRDGKRKLVVTSREPTPVVQLAPGDYVVNASFGRANLTRKVTLKPAAEPQTEQFVLNAGGLRVTALLGTQPAPRNMVTYSIMGDERDQLSSRDTVMTGAKPDLIIRLNSGLYQIVSTYGDANAVVRADVNVEAGKLTEATIVHAAAKVSFKLVTRAGGEAIADTQWSIQTLQGQVVKESVGALPTHHLAPGNYSAIATSGGRSFRRDFSVQSGDNVEVEIVLR